MKEIESCKVFLKLWLQQRGGMSWNMVGKLIEAFGREKNQL